MHSNTGLSYLFRAVARSAPPDTWERDVFFIPKKRKHHGSNWIRRDKRWAIYHRDGFLCVWCGGDSGGLTLDHLFPYSSRHHDNHHRRLVTACFTCNRQRRDKRLSVWLRVYAKAGWQERLRIARTRPLDIKAAKEVREMLWAPLAVDGPMW